MSQMRPTAKSSKFTALTGERAARLYQLLHLLADGPQDREVLAKRLRLNVRDFYRDLEKLRDYGIDLPMDDGLYTLAESFEKASARLPFPDPHLTLAEAVQLAKGRSAVHRKLKKQITAIVGMKRGKKRRGKKGKGSRR